VGQVQAVDDGLQSLAGLAQDACAAGRPVLVPDICGNAAEQILEGLGVQHPCVVARRRLCKRWMTGRKGGRHCKLCCCDFCADSSALGVKNWEMFACVVNRRQFCMSLPYDGRFLFHSTAQQKAVDFFVEA
jgi:hypothetical protein